MAPWTLVRLLCALAARGSLGARYARKGTQMSGHIGLAPPNTGLKAVAVIMNPGGGVPSNLYQEHMQRWQEEAAEHGLSMWVGLLEYWGDLPLPIRLGQNIDNALKKLKEEDGMPEDAAVFYAGHSMGGGVFGDVALKNFKKREVKGLIVMASYLNAKYFPPMADDFSFPMPTLTVGADLNFGAARITRMAAAAYRQRNLSASDYPFVMIEGMNHMQFATGFEKEDLKPEKDDATAQGEVARVIVAFIHTKLGRWGTYESWRGDEIIRSETKKTNTLFAPIYTAFELEGDAKFNVPNQVSAPNSDCPRGVCPDSSEWINVAQSYILGDQVMARVAVKNNFADLNPWSFASREPRKPFITDNVIQAYVMASNTKKDFENDVKKPVANNELLAKFISRQAAKLEFFGEAAANDPDFCAEMNQLAFDKAMELASPLARQRFEAHGQPMVFEPTEYKTIGPQWTGANMEYKEKDGNMAVKSYGLFTPPGDRAIDGNHYCKLLTPARALEWIYVDGLKKELYGIW